jgi:complement component 1 Q subcomponent-binding protein
MMFSIADIQSAEEEPEYEQEDAEGGEDQPLHSYPVRTSFSITKVWLHVKHS